MSQLTDTVSPAGKAEDKAPVSAKTSACVPCFKRKMKCNRGMPCSNCKRRRDQSEPCHYPTTPSAASVAELSHRLEKLENYIRAIGVDPDMVVRDRNLSGQTQTPVTPKSTNSTPGPSFGSKPVDMLATVWPGRYTWGAVIPQRLPSPPGRSESGEEALEIPNTFTLFTPVRPIPFLAYEYPSPPIIQRLWNHYLTHVHMMHKLFFEWQKAPLIEKACNSTSTLAPDEHAFVLNLLFFTVSTLSQERCQEMLSKDVGKAIESYQYLAEYALWEAGVAAVANLEAYQGLMMYVRALRNIGNISGGMFSTLTAIATRQAERLGLHQDPLKLGMTPAEVEERRRVWWQTVCLDLTGGIVTGCVPMSVYADWTTQQPGNYEDLDFAPNQTSYPPERSGITGMSQSLLLYHTFAQGRKVGSDGKRMGMTWTYKDSLTPGEKMQFVNDFSTMIDNRFLRHCEPFLEHHVLLQLEGRKMLTAFRWLLYSPARNDLEPAIVEPESRDMLFDLAVKSIEYQAFAMTSDVLKEFVWYTKHGFMWPALVYALIDVRHRIPGTPHLARFWESINKLYEKHYTPFRNLRSPLYLATANLVLDTWTVHVSDEQEATAPQFVLWLRENLPASGRAKKVKRQTQPVQQQVPINGGASGVDSVELTNGAAQSEGIPSEWAQFGEEFSAEAFLQDLASTDWSFWDTF